LQFIARHEGTDLGRQLTKELIPKIGTVETEVLQGCISNKTKHFQFAVAAELFDRDALTEANVQLICERDDADIRLIGVKALAKQNLNLTPADVRKILVKPRRSNPLALSTSAQVTDYPGEQTFKNYEIGILGKLKYEQLLSLQKDEWLYSTEATLALYLHQFKRVKTQLAENLLDGFEKFCSERRVRLTLSPADGVFKYIKEELLQLSLEAFCSQATGSDLPIVRTTLDGNPIKFSVEISKFLMKYGEWQDAARVVKLSANLKYDLGRSLLRLQDHSTNYQLAATAILNLGAKRVADAWNLDMPNSVRVQFVAQMPQKSFAVFDDQRIIQMLLTDSDDVRETVALKAVLCLSKARLRRILNAYYKVGKSYYYNAIFWLDLGIAADRETSKTIASRELTSK
jgi:hypothetical protein